MPLAATLALTPTVALAPVATAAIALGPRACVDAFRLGHERFPGQPQAAALVALDELHADAVALLDHILSPLSAAVLHLGDVQQPFGARHDLDERAERGGG